MSAPDPTPGPATSQRGFTITLIGVLLLSFGLTFVLFGALYARDLQALARTPEILWYALCGQPLPSDAAGPLLFGGGFAASMAGALVLVGGRPSAVGRRPSTEDG